MHKLQLEGSGNRTHMFQQHRDSGHNHKTIIFLLHTCAQFGGPSHFDDDIKLTIILYT